MFWLVSSSWWPVCWTAVTSELNQSAAEPLGQTLPRVVNQVSRGPRLRVYCCSVWRWDLWKRAEGGGMFTYDCNVFYAILISLKGFHVDTLIICLNPIKQLMDNYMETGVQTGWKYKQAENGSPTVVWSQGRCTKPGLFCLAIKCLNLFIGITVMKSLVGNKCIKLWLCN